MKIQNVNVGQTSEMMYLSYNVNCNLRRAYICLVTVGLIVPFLNADMIFCVDNWIIEIIKVVNISVVTLSRKTSLSISDFFIFLMNFTVVAELYID